MEKRINWFIAAVWLVNGMYAKILHQVPRHEQIVARILGDEWAGPLTRLIGVAEVLMAVWILTGYRRRLNALVQISIVAAMNALECALAPDLLLWGYFNAVFALLFIALVYWNAHTG